MVAAHRAVSFQEAIPLFFKNYTNFTGRSSRGAYWWWFLANLLISFVLGFIDGLLFGVSEMGIGILSGLFALATIIPSIAIGFRRLHDVDKTAWWLLIALIPLVGAIVLIWFTVQPGTPGGNKFGSDTEAGRPEGQHLSSVFE